MKKVTQLLLLNLLITFTCFSQTTTKSVPQNARPKLVVGIVIDQMRWDFLYRYSTDMLQQDLSD